MVGVGIKTAAVAFYGGVGVQHQRQQLIQAGVHIGLGNFAGPYGGQQLPHGVPAGGGISSVEPFFTPSAWSLLPPQSVTTAPSKPHSSRRISCKRWAFSLA